MVGLFLVLSLMAAGLILPGWLAVNRQRPRSAWPLGLPAAGLAFWASLAWGGAGAQSLSNVLELPMVAIGAVVAAYLKFFALDRRFGPGSVSAAMALAIVALVTLGLRLFMPALPE